MGLNLPVQRIVFLETDKFNGRTVRPLQSSEIQQIAGRAGRFGMFPQGLVSTFKDDMAFIGHGLTSTVPPITDAMLSFPEALLTIDAKVSRILSEWNDMAASAGFLKATVKTQISLAEHLESYTTDKELIYSLITIPFDERDNELYDLWSELSLALIRRKDLLDLIDEYNMPSSFTQVRQQWYFMRLFDLYLTEVGYFLHIEGHSNAESIASRMKLYLDNNTSRRVTLEELAEVVHLDKSYIIRLFRQFYQETPISYHQKVRIKRAKSMLLYTNLSVTEIASNTGFSSIHDFDRVFRKMDGAAPSVYRPRRIESTAR